MTSENPTDAENKPSVGECLKQGRLRQRLSILECAKRTHISSRYLEALEEERWDVLPSESHRLGFLRLYARFLGVPSEEIVSHYQRGQPPVVPSESKPPAGKKSADPAAFRSSSSQQEWYPTSISQLPGVVIVVLIASWGIYHVVRRHLPEQRFVSIVRLRPHQSPRLISSQHVVTQQKIRVQAQARSFLRVVGPNGLTLFEGNLPAGAVKESAGPGPFDLKMDNVRALTVFWNDQPVDIQSAAHGDINEIRLPLAK